MVSGNNLGDYVFSTMLKIKENELLLDRFG